MERENLRNELAVLLEKIEATSEKKRHVYHHELDRILLNMRVHDMHIPPEVVELNEELRTEVVEAQFDNMPV